MKMINSVNVVSTITALIIMGLLNTKCERTNSNLPLTFSDTTSFIGTFKTIDDSNIQGTISLSLFNKNYVCATNLPFGHGAGELQIDNTTIDFIDTLFFPIPAIYGPSYVLSGKHDYSFDGENLKIWRNKNVGKIEYYLKIIKKN
jgi:hypothetical protein